MIKDAETFMTILKFSLSKLYCLEQSKLISSYISPIESILLSFVLFSFQLDFHFIDIKDTKILLDKTTEMENFFNSLLKNSPFLSLWFIVLLLKQFDEDYKEREKTEETRLINKKKRFIVGKYFDKYPTSKTEQIPLDSLSQVQSISFSVIFNFIHNCPLLSLRGVFMSLFITAHNSFEQLLEEKYKQYLSEDNIPFIVLMFRTYFYVHTTFFYSLPHYLHFLNFFYMDKGLNDEIKEERDIYIKKVFKCENLLPIDLIFSLLHDTEIKGKKNIYQNSNVTLFPPLLLQTLQHNSHKFFPHFVDLLDYTIEMLHKSLMPKFIQIGYPHIVSSIFVRVSRILIQCVSCKSITEEHKKYERNVL
jgi:hypothetical protein